MRHIWRAIWTAVLALGICRTFAEHPDREEPSDLGEMTVITSDRLTFDYQEQFALFEGNVIVTDPELKLSADEMHVRFVAGGSVESISAKGSVVIEQADGVEAFSDTAHYDVALGEVILEGNPRVRRGNDLLSAERITLWREDGRMVCEPRARLVIFPEEGSPRDFLFGDR